MMAAVLVLTGKQDVSGGDKVGTSLFGIVTLLTSIFCSPLFYPSELPS